MKILTSLENQILLGPHSYWNHYFFYEKYVLSSVCVISPVNLSRLQYPLGGPRRWERQKKTYSSHWRCARDNHPKLIRRGVSQGGLLSEKPDIRRRGNALGYNVSAQPGGGKIFDGIEIQYRYRGIESGSIGRFNRVACQRPST